MDEPGSPEFQNCARCGTQVGHGLLVCPRCHRLVHADELTRLSAEAAQQTEAGELADARDTWTRVFELLPADTSQSRAVQAKLAALERKIGATAATPRRKRKAASHSNGPDKAKGTGKRLAGLGAIGLLLWKLKWVLGFALTKGKLLLAGLTKGSTFFSMMLSLGVYWTAFGWKFALGLVLSIYVHEMGHVARLRHYGIPASPPMFIPGIGAVVRLKVAVTDPIEDARIGLAGPLWGLGAALAAWVVFLATGWPIWAAIARVGAWINLFNLLPVWQLDGGRGFQSMNRHQRWLATAVIAATWFLTGEGLLVLLLIASVAKAFSRRAPEEPDSTGLLLYVALIGTLGAMCLIEVPMAAS